MSERPYTPETLAERWQCSPETVRLLLVSGDLRGWKIGGKLWRISSDAVEEYEGQQQQQIAPSSDSESASCITKPPYTPETMAERWQCSHGTVRLLLVSGDLRGWKIGGKLWRIPVAAVEAYECQPTSNLAAEAKPGLSAGTTKLANAIADDLMQQRKLRRMLRRAAKDKDKE
jgi:excisionase family DNA binding protein